MAGHSSPHKAQGRLVSLPPFLCDIPPDPLLPAPSHPPHWEQSLPEIHTFPLLRWGLWADLLPLAALCPIRTNSSGTENVACVCLESTMFGARFCPVGQALLYVPHL